jgi:hypothetical protein
MLTPTVLLAPEAATRPPVVATGGQLTLVGGWDSTPIPGGSPSAGAAFTGVEAYGNLRVRERGEDSHEAKVIGRAFVYPGLPEAGANARASLLWTSRVRIHARARFTFSLASSIGATRDARGTDGTPTPYDAISSQRTDGTTRATLGFVHELTPSLRFSETIGFGLGATISERLVGTGLARSPGLDFLTTDVGGALSHRVSARSTWEYSLRFDRARLLDVIDATGATLQPAGSLDLASAAAAVRFGYLVGVTTTAWASVGATLATTMPSAPSPDAASGVSAVPTLAIGLSHRTEASTFGAQTGFEYSLVDPRLGPGAGASVRVSWLGQPIRSVRGLEIMLTADGSRTAILGGPNEGGAFVSFNGSAQLRGALSSWLGVVGGAELRYSRLDGGSVFSREVVFLGLSSAWWSDVRSPSLATLTAPAQPGF